MGTRVTEARLAVRVIGHLSTIARRAVAFSTQVPTQVPTQAAVMDRASHPPASLAAGAPRAPDAAADGATAKAEGGSKKELLTPPPVVLPSSPDTLSSHGHLLWIIRLHHELLQQRSPSQESPGPATGGLWGALLDDLHPTLSAGGGARAVRISLLRSFG